MQESIKAILGLFVIVALFATVLSWFSIDPNPGPYVWAWRIGSPLVGVAFFGLIMWMQFFREDLLPDFLGQLCLEAAGDSRCVFERDGFCFVIWAIVTDGQSYLVMPFQNRYLRPSEVRVLVSPSQGLIRRAKLPSVEFRLTCGPGEFGTARCTWPIPREYEGTTQKLDVAALVRYPAGRGRLVRHRTGAYVGRMGGGLISSSPAFVKLELPIGMEHGCPQKVSPETFVEVLWQPPEEMLWGT